MSRIDDRTWVPLGVVAALFSIGISVTVVGAFWVKGVDDRLARIEDKLGIPHDEADFSLVKNASAKVKR